MTSPLDGHPAVDIATATAAVVLQDRVVVGLDPWLLDAAVSCRRESVQLQLVTPASSRLTAPLAAFLSEHSGRWVVRSEESRWYDGASGQLLDWDGNAFVPIGDQIANEFVEGYSPTRGSLVLDVTVSHAASTTLMLGRIVEDCCAELTLGPPAGWGVAEPATQLWDRGALTALCRGRAPRPTALVVIGGQPDALALGTLVVSRTASRVVERLRLSVGNRTVDAARFEALAERLAHLPAPPRTMLTGLQPGRSDGTVEPRLTGPVVPYGFLAGPDVVTQVGADRIVATPAARVELIGPKNGPSCWIRVLGESADADPATMLASTLAYLGMPGPQLPDWRSDH
jgi:Family of unknown function (DUF6177)